MNRREFVLAASGVAGGAVAAIAATPVAAQEDGDEEDEADPGDEEENGEAENGEAENGEDENGNGAATGGGTETVEVDDNEFVPDSLTIEPGTTVEWVWVGSADHNVDPGEQPEGADWGGHPELQADGEYEHTFDVEGTYEYVCTPHIGVGMTGTIDVTEDGADEAAAGADVDIHDIGVPIQKHFVGVATFLAIFVSLVFTFYLLKYGESAHTSSPGRRN